MKGDNLPELMYSNVINKSRFGRVLLVKNLKNKKNYALKYFHKWKICEKREDELFFTLALKMSRYVRKFIYVLNRLKAIFQPS